MSFLNALKNTRWCKCMTNIHSLPSTWVLGSGHDAYVVMKIWRQQLGWSVKAFDHDDSLGNIRLIWEKPDGDKKSSGEIVRHVFPSGNICFKACKDCHKCDKK